LHHRRLTLAPWLALWLCLLGALAPAPRAAGGAARPAALDASTGGLPNVSAASPKIAAVSAGDQWMATYGGLLDDTIASVAQTQDGGFVVAGLTNSFGAGGGDIWVLRLKSDGSIAWQKTYGDPDSYETASFVGEAQDGSLYVVCSSSALNYTSNRICVLKLNT
jgi:hypothetical protein